MKNVLKIASLVFGMSAAGMVTAAPSPVSGSFLVTASVAKSCAISGTTNVAFSAYDPADANFSVPLDAGGGVTVRCTKNVGYDVKLDQGANAATGSSCSAPSRRMASGAERLSYALFQNAGRTTVWGCDVSNDLANTETVGPSSPDTLTVYGRIPAGQDVADGSYSDTVTVTVTF
jgi:spore coat protein U-like protein